MSPEKQRLLIAEACGWNVYTNPQENSGHRYSAPKGTSPFLGRHTLPDFLKDLNAMHEAEKCSAIRAVGYAFAYLPNLAVVVRRDALPHQFDDEDIRNACVFATAAQRAEAFLKTLGLWEEKE